MAVSDLDVKARFAGNGVTTSFAIPCAFIPTEASSSILVYKILLSSGAMTLQTEGGGADYTLTPAYNPVTQPLGPTNVVFNSAPSALYNILVIRSLALAQTTSLVPNSPVPPRTVETGLDRLLFMIQELAEKAGRAILAPHINNFTSNIIPLATAGYVLRVNAAGDGWELVNSSAILAAAGGGLPAGGAAGDFVEKASAIDDDADWISGSYSGISLLTGAQFTSTGLKDTLDKIIRITYTAPTISLSMVGSGTLREKGASVASSLMTAAITKKSNDVGDVRFYQGATLLSTQTGNPPVPSGGSPTYNYASAFTDTISFSAQTTDILAGGNGPTNVISSTVTFSFVYPYYWGVGATGLTPAQVAALTKTVQNNTNSQAVAFTPAVGQKYYFAYPASYGALTSILDQNNFETIADWTLTKSNITGLDASAVSYRIYSFNNLVGVAGTYSYTFKK